MRAPIPFEKQKSASRRDAEIPIGCIVLGLTLVIGLATAGDYGITIDEFNTEDYGPNALAWYLSGFTDRSQFAFEEMAMYGPWAQMLISAVQSLGLASALTVRHAVTFVIGLAGVAALLPLGRLVAGQMGGADRGRAVPDHRIRLRPAVLCADRHAVSRRHVLVDACHCVDGTARDAVVARHHRDGPCHRVGARHPHRRRDRLGLSVRRACARRPRTFASPGAKGRAVVAADRAALRERRRRSLASSPLRCGPGCRSAIRWPSSPRPTRISPRSSW